MKYTENELALIALSGVSGVGAKRMSALLAVVDEPREVFSLHRATVSEIIGEKQVEGFWRAASKSYQEDMAANLSRLSMRAVCRFTDDYPPLLEEIFDPPYVLYIKGTIRLTRERLLAVVGSRNASRYGLECAHALSRDLAAQGVTIISGMARGIDSAAHVGALKAGGSTMAVFGSGLDVCYPPENLELYEEIAQKGLLISEYLPGTSPLPAFFRQRNRIIAGLSQALLLIEGRQNSGAMITVDHALDSSREVFAVPGQINSPLSFQPNRLIRQGAGMVLEARDIMEPMQWSSPSAVSPRSASRKTPLPELSDEEKLIVEPLLTEELSFDELCRKTGFKAERLNSLLTMLSLRGIIKQHPGRVFSI
ncbi:MAG: DNA-processing protein DprA [Christensenellales bacterium]|jgi:DNA processing protein